MSMMIRYHCAKVSILALLITTMPAPVYATAGCSTDERICAAAKYFQRKGSDFSYTHIHDGNSSPIVGHDDKVNNKQDGHNVGIDSNCEAFDPSGHDEDRNGTVSPNEMKYKSTSQIGFQPSEIVRELDNVCGPYGGSVLTATDCHSFNCEGVGSIGAVTACTCVPKAR